MRIPLRHILIFPDFACKSPACLPDVLQQPLIERLPVVDELDIPYAFDLSLTEGAYLFIFCAFAWSQLRRHLQQIIKDSESE